eukprot:scaffold99909_cov69-Phaeocystis_antarctica.AAC.2
MPAPPRQRRLFLWRGGDDRAARRRARAINGEQGAHGRAAAQQRGADRPDGGHGEGAACRARRVRWPGEAAWWDVHEALGPGPLQPRGALCRLVALVPVAQQRQ